MIDRSVGNNGWLADGGFGGNVTTNPHPDPENPVLDPNIYQFQRDGDLVNNPPLSGGWNELTFSLPVEAGTTYTITTPLRTGRGNGTPITWRSDISLSIDGAEQWAGTTKTGFVAPELPDYGYYTPTASYMATETKAVTVTIRLFTPWRNNNGDDLYAVSDDFWVTIPTITCQ